jgi:hypothetical protein
MSERELENIDEFLEAFAFGEDPRAENPLVMPEPPEDQMDESEEGEYYYDHS